LERKKYDSPSSLVEQEVTHSLSYEYFRNTFNKIKFFLAIFIFISLTKEAKYARAKSDRESTKLGL